MKKNVLFFVICFIALFAVACTNNANKLEESQNQPNIDLTDFEQLKTEFIAPIVLSTIGAENWTNANDIPAEYFDSFYAFKVLPKERSQDKSDVIAQKDYESYIQNYFDVTSEHLKTSDTFSPSTNSYTIGYLGSSASFAVTDAKIKNDTLTLQYEYYSPADDTTVIRKGTLVIKFDGENYKYLSNTSNEIN
ncbi:hypothetical protein EDD70_2862 [Hydrogenoanaerobacterium saccharovorans]|uniref:Bla regulator protein blaR1 n=1 Tax=Hydrogenoanaerobacterium saccharovorans TaxID=474960 RepID=A0A1H8E4M4_9FIRM|nr:DUF6070 family protein [Hydrogenoanaerobacterium saccharovorans]RPF42119.1 hypothetical protein EDD70_2862 [Hydrogenoanaerobacterium saccharovorans]SEN14064.1 hypothetical protein SAMN05216180_2878 [Hydrogenoanaerobacterium saccharovorans]